MLNNFFFSYHFMSPFAALCNFLLGYDTHNATSLSLAHFLTHCSLSFFNYKHKHVTNMQQASSNVPCHPITRSHVPFPRSFYARFFPFAPRACLPASWAAAVEKARITTREATLDSPSIDKALVRALAGSNAAAKASRKTRRMYKNR